MSRLRFRAKIEINNINPYVLVNAKRVAKIQKGWRKPLPVRFRVNSTAGRKWRINLMPMGDVVAVEIEFDKEYKNGPMHPMPGLFSEALNENPKAKRAWSELIPSRQKEILRYFANLKSPEARAKNLRRAISVLSGSKERFLGRAWSK